MSTFMLIFNITYLTFITYTFFHIFKTDRAMDKMFKDFDEKIYKKLKACVLELTTDEALELIHEVVEIPDKYYLGVNSEDILEVTLFECDENMPNKMGKSIETFTLESYKSNELISFGIELIKYIDNLEVETL